MLPDAGITGEVGEPQGSAVGGHDIAAVRWCVESFNSHVTEG